MDLYGSKIMQDALNPLFEEQGSIYFCLVGKRFCKTSTKSEGTLFFKTFHKNYINGYNPFPNKPWFLRVCKTSLLKVVTFYHRVNSCF